MKNVLYLLLFLIIALIGYVKFKNMNINDIGLKVLSLVKKVKGESVDLATLEASKTDKINHAIWTKLLQNNVTTEGKVNYKGFITQQAQLDNYLDLLSANPPGNNWTDAEKMAYWINTYNAFTVKLILDNYPLKSIKDIGDGLPMINSPWDIKFFKIGTTAFDLNTIEHEILRKQFDDPRIHFAINCASFSCPRLRTEAFEANQLEAQLEDQASYFINNPTKNKISEQGTKLSNIFSWFESDFNKKSSVKAYLKKYHAAFNPEQAFEYLDYNWTLNE